MRITSLSGLGLLCFDQFNLDLNKRVTFMVGPNGAGRADVEAIMTLSERMSIDLKRRNIAVIDCGSRDNLRDSGSAQNSA